MSPASSTEEFLNPLRPGDTLRRARRISKFTQPDLSKLSGVSVGQIGQVERGTSNPSWLLMVAMLNSLGFEVTISKRKG